MARRRNLRSISTPIILGAISVPISMALLVGWTLLISQNLGNDSEITLDDLVPRLTAIAQNGYDERIYVRGDQDVGYGSIMSVMGRLNAAGFKRIGLVTQQEPQTSSN